MKTEQCFTPGTFHDVTSPSSVMGYILLLYLNVTGYSEATLMSVYSVHPNSLFSVTSCHVHGHAARSRELVLGGRCVKQCREVSH